MRRQRIASCVGLALTAACAAAATPAGTPPARKVVPVGDVRVYPVDRQVVLDAEVCLREGVLEFLMVAWQSKTHESVLHTKAKASHLHAGLLLLGLTPGKPARWSGEDEHARFLPPAGAGLKMEAAWKDKAGKDHRVDVGQWLKGSDGKQIVRPKEWVFVGSEVLPGGKYWAELDGEIISVTNFASAVIDVPFRSSNANEQREYYAGTADIPPVGTKVEVIVTALPGAEKALDARKLVEIDRFGRVFADGEVMTPEKLQDWATKYIDRHERGMVVLRADGLALVADISAARLNLRLGGVREFDVQRVPPAGPVLPRTRDQFKWDLKEWDEKFANPREFIEEPGGQARRAVDLIRLRMAELEARKALLKEYADQLERSLHRYKASTQPAGGAAQ